MAFKQMINGKPKKILWNIIASGLPADHDLERLRKNFIVNPIIIVGIIFLAILGSIAFVQHDYILSSVDFGLLLFLASQLFYLRKSKNIEIISLVGTIIAGFFFLFLVAYGGITQTAFVWALTYPLIAQFLLGVRLGSYLSFSLLGMSCAVFALAPSFNYLSQFSINFIVRFVAVYITIHLVGLIMEFTRGKVHQRLKTSNLDLEKALERVQKSTDALGQTNQQLQTEINERKCIEKALRRSESFLDDIIESIQDGITVLDPDLTIRHTNSVIKHWHQDKLPLIGKKCHQCFHNLSQPCEPCPTIRCLESGKTEREIISLLPSGPVEYMEVYCFPIKDNETGKITGVVEFCRDITGRKRLERQLAHAHKMEAVGTLAGGVAHDLNNILSGIVSYPELILMDLPQDSPMRKKIQTIQKSGQKAAAIVQDLLTLARRGVRVNEVVNLNTIVSSFIDSPECQKIKEFHPKISIELSLQDDLSNINGSPIQLLKTVMNLVSNAAEAMSEYGTISLATTNQSLDKQVIGYEKILAGEYVVLTVSDSGNGISPDDLSKIFEPFYTKKSMGRSGTGLGMAVVWGTVKDLNGFIDIESTPGKGTRVSSYFPMTLQEPPQKIETIPVEAYRGKEKILIVDDAVEQREIASAILTRIGYSVAVESSGEDAIQYLKNKTADLVILDMVMDTGMDGLSTYKKIIKSHPYQKAIIASGYSETTRVKEALRLGAGGYIKKPYSIEEIGLAVKTELSK